MSERNFGCTLVEAVMLFAFVMVIILSIIMIYVLIKLAFML